MLYFSKVSNIKKAALPLQGRTAFSTDFNYLPAAGSAAGSATGSAAGAAAASGCGSSAFLQAITENDKENIRTAASKNMRAFFILANLLSIKAGAP